MWHTAPKVIKINDEVLKRWERRKSEEIFFWGGGLVLSMFLFGCLLACFVLVRCHFFF